MNFIPETIEATVSGAASKVTSAGSAVSVMSWMAAYDIGLWIGIAAALGGLAVNWYFKRKDDRRLIELHKAYMAKLLHEGVLIIPPSTKKDGA